MESKKTKEKKQYLVIGLYIIFITMFIVGASVLVYYYLDENGSQKKSEQLAEDVIIWSKEKSGEGTDKQDVSEEESKIPRDIEFEKLLAQNEDTVAWIYCEDTEINYPIVQASDNDYYLRRGFDKKSNRDGSIFMDANNTNGFTDRNTIIYGHNMKSGNMFHDLALYKASTYYEKHPVMYLYTDGHNYKLELIAGCVIDGYDEIYNLNKTVLEVNADIERMRKKSTFQSDVTYTDDDRLVTLSTCSYERDDARYVVIGKLVEW